MEIEKLYFICPTCFQVNDEVVSLVNEKYQCSECGVISNASDYTISSTKPESSLNHKSIYVSVINDGENWSLIIKPRHTTHIISRLLFTIVPLLLSVFLLAYKNAFGVILLIIGLLFGWELLVRLFGKVEFIVKGDKLTHFEGIGSLGSQGTLRWSKISNVHFHRENFRLIFNTPDENQDTDENIGVYFDLSDEQMTFVENYIYNKIDIRDKKIANVNSGPDTEELNL